MSGAFTFEAYVRDVLSGEQVACRWVRLACERHVRDLEEGEERGLWFDEQKAREAIAFFKLLKHSKGEWAGRPLTLEPWQQFVVASLLGWRRTDGTRRYRTAYLEVARKNGKTTLAAGLGLYLMLADGEPGAEVYSVAPLDVDTPVPTLDGWTTMGEVKEGDTLFDETGAPCTVTYVAPVQQNHQCFELEFDDGTKIVADAEHRWQTEVYSSGRSLEGRSREEFYHTRKGSRTTGIYTTQEILDSLYYESKGRKSTNHRIPLAGTLQTPDASLPIPPYTFGVWLGDGRANRGAIVIHPDDRAIARRIQDDGFEISEHGAEDSDGLFRFTVLGLRTALRENDLLERKHIPDIYLRSSPAQRLALLRGLMDTDGTVATDGECRFTNRNKRLIDGVCELVAGLNMKPHLSVRPVQGRSHYIISFKAYADLVRISNLERKYDRQRRRPHGKGRNRYIVAVRPVPTRPVRCIRVDSPSHLFLVSRGLVATHNTKRDQARLSHGEATRMAKSSPAIRRMVNVYRDNIHIVDTASKFEPLGADADTMDGLNVHAALVDEVHAHKTRQVWDVIETATGARRQPLMLAITTSGYNRQSLCWQLHEYTQQVLDGVIEDDSWFGAIYTLDEDDDWEDESLWPKANPNLGVSKKWDDMRRKAARAREMPAALNAFLRLELDIWTQAETKWIPIEHWQACGDAVDAEGLRGRICYGGLDLSTNTDVTAFVLVFPPQSEDDAYQVLPRFWIPEEAMVERSRRDRVPYDAWVRQGLITATPGNVIDYAWILHQIDEDAQAYDIQEVAFDRWGATKIATELMERGGDDWMVQFGQGYVSMSPAMREMERLILEHKLAHGNNPVLTWMANNLVVRTDPAGNIKPDKEKSIERIDGMVALVMALDRALRHEPPKRSVYETRGLVSA